MPGFFVHLTARRHLDGGLIIELMNKFAQRCFTVFLLAIFLHPAVVLAQSQSEMNLQAENDFAKSDAQLNVVYKKLIAKLDATSTEKLRVSQRAWLSFRTA